SSARRARGQHQPAGSGRSEHDQRGCYSRQGPRRDVSHSILLQRPGQSCLVAATRRWRRGAPQICGNVEAVVGRGGGFADFVDADAAVTDENWPQRGRLVFVADRAPEPRLVLWQGLGGGLQVLDFTFELGDLDLEVAVRAAQYLDLSARDLVRAGRL